MLGDDLAAVLPELRRHAVSRMSETVRVGRYEIDDEPDPVTLEYGHTFTVAYEGAARIKFPTLMQLTETDAVASLVTLQVPEIHLPSGVTGVEVDMRVVVDASTADPAIVGRVFRIKGRPTAGQTTAARFPIEDSGEQIEVGS